MLDVKQFPFVLDLACMASRREFLKLDKWVAEKIKELQVCVHTSTSSFAHCSYCKQ